jgi:F-box and WD-40 domain protein 1/11
MFPCLISPSTGSKCTKIASSLTADGLLLSPKPPVSRAMEIGNSLHFIYHPHNYLHLFPSVYCVEFDHDKIITGSRDKQIKVWSLATGKVLATLRGHEGSVLCLAFESRSGFMVSGSSDRRVLVWDLNALRAEGMRPRAVLEGHAGGVLDLRIDAQWIVSCSKDATVRVWSRATLEHMYTLKGHHGPVNAVGLDAGLIVSASGDGTMILWDVARGVRKAHVRTFAGHERGLACVDFHGDVVVSGSNDMTIKIWCASTGECVQTLTGHTALVRALSFDERMERLVSTSYDKTVIVWEIKPRSVEEGGGARAKRLRQFSGHHESHVFDVNFDATRIIRYV